MSDLFNATLGAVGQVGDAVDKVTGGRALRGVLAGKPRELASVIPFSDSMGLTNEKDKTSGRNLTDAYGITSQGDHSFGAHAAGFLADNVLSPANMLGAYGAFKAAPTIAKGLTQGAKALSGLDIVDHLGAGAKSLGKFASGESGAFRGPHIAPKPIDVDSLHAESLAANATRPRRWSADPAERAYYSADRGRRYAERMSGREIPNPASGPSGIPEFSLHDAFRKFAGDESGSLSVANFGGRMPSIPLPADQANRIARNALLDASVKMSTHGGLIHNNAMAPMNIGAEEMVHKFLHAPDFSASPSAVKDAEAFAGKIDNGASAAIKYAGSGYRGVNQSLRRVEGGQLADELARIRSGAARTPDAPGTDTDFGNVGGDVSRDHIIAGLMDLMDHSALPKEMKLWRGVGGKAVKDIEGRLGVSLRSPEAVGKEFTDPGFLSTTTDRGEAHRFSNYADAENPNTGVTFQFPNVPAGKTGSYINPFEQEVLFPPGRRIKITDNSNFPHLKAELYTLLAAFGLGGAGAATQQQGE